MINRVSQGMLRKARRLHHVSLVHRLRVAMTTSAEASIPSYSRPHNPGREKRSTFRRSGQWQRLIGWRGAAAGEPDEQSKRR